MKTSKHSVMRRPSLWLLVSFGLTIAAFLVAAIVSEISEEGITTAAHSIASDAAPSVAAIGDVRTELRHLEVLINNSLLRLAPTSKQSVGALEEVDRSRDALRRAWSIYMALAVYPAERPVQPEADSQMLKVEYDIDRVLHFAREAQPEKARLASDRDLRPDIDEFDTILLHLMDLNARATADLADDIDVLHRRSRFWSLLLNVLAVLFAFAWGSWSLMIVRQNGRLLATQVDEMEQFAGRVAHDIRSPLTSMGLALSAVQREETNPKLLRLGERGARSLERVNQLVEGLLVFARAGAQPDSTARAEVHAVLNGVFEEAGPIAASNNVELARSESERAPKWVACSTGALHSLIANLVINALRHMGDSSVRRVEVRTTMAPHSGRRGPEMLRVEVEDTGPGLPPELQEEAFRPYVRGRTAGTGGLGLGLATVRRLANAHGGTVGVRSRVGQGALFWFELPAAPPPPSTPVPPTPSPAP